MKLYYWIIIAICAVLSMFFSAADMVYGVVDKDKLERDISKGRKVKKAKLALKIAKDYEFSISAILFGNNVVNIFAMDASVDEVEFELNGAKRQVRFGSASEPVRVISIRDGLQQTGCCE